MRLIAMAALLALLPACAYAQGQSQPDCGPLQMVNTIPMLRSLNESQDLVPILFDAGQKFFLFDTGGSRTQITLVVAEEMKLELHDGTIRMQDITGKSLAKMAHVNEFVLGHLKSDGAYFPVSPSGPNVDGLFALDYLLNYDADVDFGTDTLNFFSPNHCPGHVIYWQAPAVAVLPMKVDGAFHMIVPVVIDGQQLDALIDTGAAETSLRSDIAESKFHLVSGDADTPESGALNGVAALTTYQHIFKSLTFGDVAVTNPHVTIFPVDRRMIIDSMGGHPAPPSSPVAIIGMDVLRKLHLYMAFKESKIYVSTASVNSKPPAVFPAAYFAANIARMTAATAHEAQNPAVWNNRCFWRGLAKADLDGALADCEQSLKLKPNWGTALYSKGIVLYQQGKYQDAVAAFDASLATDPNAVNALFMRGQAKAKLGDTAGGTADLDAAKGSSPGILTDFQRMGLAA